jgi:hypothetical protein
VLPEIIVPIFLRPAPLLEEFLFGFGGYPGYTGSFYLFYEENLYGAISGIALAEFLLFIVPESGSC